MPESVAVGPCNCCSRTGKLRYEHTYPAGWAGLSEPWTHRYYLCRWHQAAETRWRHRQGGQEGVSHDQAGRGVESEQLPQSSQG